VLVVLLASTIVLSFDFQKANADDHKSKDKADKGKDKGAEKKMQEEKKERMGQVTVDRTKTIKVEIQRIIHPVSKPSPNHLQRSLPIQSFRNLKALRSLKSREKLLL
jgi:hypothetical protein